MERGTEEEEGGGGGGREEGGGEKGGEGKGEREKEMVWNRIRECLYVIDRSQLIGFFFPVTLQCAVD